MPFHVGYGNRCFLSEEFLFFSFGKQVAGGRLPIISTHRIRQQKIQLPLQTFHRKAGILTMCDFNIDNFKLSNAHKFFLLPYETCLQRFKR